MKRQLLGMLLLLLVVATPVQAASRRMVLAEGQTETYVVGANTYEVLAVMITGKTALFKVNGEFTKQLGRGDSYTLADGSVLKVLGIGSRRGVDYVRFKITTAPSKITAKLQEGETKTYTVGSKTYEVTAAVISSKNQAIFIVNGETTKMLNTGDTYKLVDGSKLTLRGTYITPVGVVGMDYAKFSLSV